jgi:hypothetical protein
LVENDLAPHGWFAAEYVALLRNMLVREDGNDLVLMGALSPRWLLPCARNSVRNADTTLGKNRVLVAGLPRRSRPPLAWVAGPRYEAQLARAEAARNVPALGLSRDRRTITLASPTGQLRVQWRLEGPFPSFVETARGVIAQYPR